MRVGIDIADNYSVREALRRSPVADQPGAEETMRRCLQSSTMVWVGTVENEVACVFGIKDGSLISNGAYLWLLSTDLVDEHTFRFVRYSQRCMEVLLNRYALITGHVDVRQSKSVRWLKWLGAEIGKPHGFIAQFQIRR